MESLKISENYLDILWEFQFMGGTEIIVRFLFHPTQSILLLPSPTPANSFNPHYIKW